MKRTALTALAVAVLLSTAGIAPASVLNSSVRHDALDDLTDGSQAPAQPSFSAAGSRSEVGVQEMAKKKKSKKKKSKAS